MAQIIDIRRVEVGPRSLTARVRIATNAPLYTSEDLQGTARVYRLLPHIIEHTCLGDSSETFKDVMGDTEIAHLLEHVTVELLAQSDIAGDISSGRTFAVEDERRTYDVEIACPDDVLVAGALSSAVWILQWAYTDGSDPEPDVEATVKGLVGLVQNLPEPEENAPSVIEYVVSGEEAEALIAEHEIFSNDVPGAEPEAIDGLDEPEGADAGPVTVDGVKESPEARQASQDVPAPRVDPEIVPEVPVHDPVPDPFPMPTFEEEIILDAAYETVEEDTMGSTMVSGRVISESEVDEIMASFARATVKEEPAPEPDAEAAPEATPEPEVEEEVAPEPDTVTEPVPVAVMEPESEQEPDRVAEVEDLEADTEREPENVAEAESEPEPETTAAFEPVAVDEPETEPVVEPEATADVEPEPVEETAEEEPAADEVVTPAPEREFVDDEIVLVPFEEPEDRVEAEPVSENVEPEPEPTPEPQPTPESAPLEDDEQFDDEVDATASFKPLEVEEPEALEPVIDNAESEATAEPEPEDSNVVDVVEENDVFEPAEEEEEGAEPAFTLPKGISWSTAASATGEWGTIPEPKFVR